jgi:hypothetical protein
MPAPASPWWRLARVSVTLVAPGSFKTVLALMEAAGVPSDAGDIRGGMGGRGGHQGPKARVTTRKNQHLSMLVCDPLPRLPIWCAVFRPVTRWSLPSCLVMASAGLARLSWAPGGGPDPPSPTLRSHAAVILQLAFHVPVAVTAEDEVNLTRAVTSSAAAFFCTPEWLHRYASPRVVGWHLSDQSSSRRASLGMPALVSVACGAVVAAVLIAGALLACMCARRVRMLMRGAQPREPPLLPALGQEGRCTLASRDAQPPQKPARARIGRGTPEARATEAAAL